MGISIYEKVLFLCGVFIFALIGCSDNRWALVLSEEDCNARNGKVSFVEHDVKVSFLHNALCVGGGEDFDFSGVVVKKDRGRASLSGASFVLLRGNGEYKCHSINELFLEDAVIGVEFPVSGISCSSVYWQANNK